MNRKTSLKVVTLTSALALLSSLSVTATPSLADNDLYQHEFTLGGDMSRYRYEETFEKVPGIYSDQKWMRLQSWQYGVNASYRFAYDKRWWAQAEVRANYGLAQYRTHWEFKHPNAGWPTFIFEPRIIGGYQINLGDYSVNPYIGLGYRWKHDDSTMLNNDGAGRPEDYGETMHIKRLNMLPYFIVGVEHRYDFTDKWFIQGRVEYNHTFYGKLFTYDRKSCPSPEEYKQKGWGIRGQIHIGHKFDKVTMTWGPYVNFWKIKRSDIINYEGWTRYNNGQKLWGPRIAYEPRNRTIEAGVSLNVTF